MLTGFHFDLDVICVIKLINYLVNKYQNGYNYHRISFGESVPSFFNRNNRKNGEQYLRYYLLREELTNARLKEIVPQESVVTFVLLRLSAFVFY